MPRAGGDCYTVYLSSKYRFNNYCSRTVVFSADITIYFQFRISTTWGYMVSHTIFHGGGVMFERMARQQKDS
jgi:hypothetical protein